MHDHSDVVPEAAYGPGALPAGHRGSGYGRPLIIRPAGDIRIGPRLSGGKTIGVFVPIRTAGTEAP
ncbi:hypothetical protein ACF05L_07200 [Streptomyces bobili]|uniref:hypothetical protein n=1 Tax=Streptomyces bobili TaxID=67280 RepID=UPI0036FBFB72